jgi:hypothetical protein
MNTKVALMLLATCVANWIPAVSALTDPRSIDTEFRRPLNGCNAVARAWIRAAFHE